VKYFTHQHAIKEVGYNGELRLSLSGFWKVRATDDCAHPSAPYIAIGANPSAVQTAALQERFQLVVAFSFQPVVHRDCIRADEAGAFVRRVG
jgi:hypothetical protein